MESMVKFKYQIRAGANSAFASKQIANTFPDVEEILIESDEYNSYSSCLDDLNGALANISRIETDLSKKNHVIVSKANPQLDKDPKSHKDLSSWDDYTLVRIYLADAERLKHSEILFNIGGQILSDHELSVAIQVES